MRPLTTALLAVLAIAFVPWVSASEEPGLRSPSAIAGTVHGAHGPIAGARVRVQATEVTTTTDALGRFALPSPPRSGERTVTAWAPGYYVGWATATPGGALISIGLKPYYTTDNVEYEWFSDEGATGSVSCSHCMPAYIEWQRDAHSRSAINPRFLSMYNGTDLDGHQSPPTGYVQDPNHGPIPQPPDPGEPYFGPGFKLDFPTSAGNCGACHVPVAAVRRAGPFAVDPNEASGVERDGVSCEFCHKIGDVYLDPQSRLPHPDRPGVLSVRLFRPSGGQQLFFGQFDDVARRVSRLPLEEESAFCAPCHFGVFAGTTIYNSYGEWLASPYSDPRSGKTCQGCHMPPAGYDAFVFPEKGGLRRDQARILSHTMPGALSEDLLRNAVTMSVDANSAGDRIVVYVRITNDRTGHHVPTDSPLRNLILIVTASDSRGTALPQLGGPTVPDWGGVGDPKRGFYAGHPGKGFAKVLQEVWTGVAPTGAYWNQTRILSDNRIAASATDISSYSFALVPGEPAVVEVRLIFRRAFRQLAAVKRWPDPDILMASQRVVLASQATAATHVGE